MVSLVDRFFRCVSPYLLMQAVLCEYIPCRKITDYDEVILEQAAIIAFEIITVSSNKYLKTEAAKFIDILACRYGYLNNLPKHDIAPAFISRKMDLDQTDYNIIMDRKICLVRSSKIGGSVEIDAIKQYNLIFTRETFQQIC